MHYSSSASTNNNNSANNTGSSNVAFLSTLVDLMHSTIATADGSGATTREATAAVEHGDTVEVVENEEREGENVDDAYNARDLESASELVRRMESEAHASSSASASAPATLAEDSNGDDDNGTTGTHSVAHTDPHNVRLEAVRTLMSDFGLLVHFIIKWVPIVVICGVIFLWNHWIGLLSVLALFVVLVGLRSRANAIITRSMTHSESTSSLNADVTPSLMETQLFLSSDDGSFNAAHGLSAVSMSLFTVFLYAGVFFYTERLWMHLWFVDSTEKGWKHGFWVTMWTSISVGYIASLLLMCIKIIMAMVIHSINSLSIAHQDETLISKRAQGIVHSLTEHASQLYRNFLPFPIWYRYLAGENMSAALLSVALVILYCITKSFSLGKRTVLIALCIRSLLFNEAIVGRLISQEEASRVNGEEGEASGEEEECSICRDGYTRPVKLACNHVFCEACIVEWCTNQTSPTSCPICRTKIGNSSIVSTSTNIDTSLAPTIM